MVRLACIAAFLAACGTSADDRPATLEYITLSVLRPTCAAVECHSTFRREQGYAFDTVEGARQSFQGDLVLIDQDAIESAGMTEPVLVLNLTLEQTGAPRMPYDAPLPNKDIDLIRNWILAGGPGICAPGATQACHGDKDLVQCTADGAYDFSQPVMHCSRSCVDGACQ